VNNGDMIRMQKLTDHFTAKNPGIELNWVTLEENALRQKVTTDIATKGGQFDVLTIGTYEVPIWAGNGADRGRDRIAPRRRRASDARSGAHPPVRCGRKGAVDVAGKSEA
jgi:sorbitol/mannitol transport system substrate-binding protein